MSFRIIIEIVLFSVLAFKIVDVALVIVDRLKLLLEKLKREVCEENALNEGQDATDERIRVARLIHVVLGASRRKQIIKSKEHQQGQVRRRQTDVNHKLHEVLVVAVSDTVVNPWTVVVHPKNTEATFRAMVGSRRLPSALLFAFLTIFDLHELALKWSLHPRWNLSGV